MSINDFEVLAENLHNVCDTDSLDFETTDEVAKLEGTIGQERALSALKLAVDIDADVYFLFQAILFQEETRFFAHIFNRLPLATPYPPDRATSTITKNRSRRWQLACPVE